MSYQQSSNEQPYPQQQPPVMAPQGGGGSIDFQGILKSQQARPYVLAGAGGILTLIGYLAFPVWGFSVKGFSEGGISVPGTSGSFNAGDVGKIGGIYGLTWLVLIASIVAAVVAGVMLFAPRSVPQLTPRLAAITLTVCGAVCVVWTVLDFLKLNSYKGSTLGLTSGISAGVSWGLYVMIITSIVMLVGGVMQLQRSPKTM